MSTSSRRGAILALALVIAAASASAQDIRARVQGLVSDPSGGVLPGATVVLTNDGTGVTATRTTSASGRYLFDFVESGTYSVSAELTGFKTTVQKSVRVQQRGDVTVDLKLEVGGIEETITVTEATTTVQFNTATRDLTIEQEMVKDLPSGTRNPLQLAMLDPTTIQRGSTVETQPYHHRTANEMDLGGGTKYRNDVLLDGTPLTAGNKLGYTPPMDAVSEYTVQQNSVDAEFGHSAGGIAIVTMKSGTNDVKGSAYFFGRDASLNAISDRATQRHNDNPYWNAGATIGLPIKKNKLFLFAVFDTIENTQSAGEQLLAPDRARAPGRLLAVLQRQRHAARHLRPADLAHRQRRAGARPVPGQHDPRESAGTPWPRRSWPASGTPTTRGDDLDRLQQLQVPGRADLPLPQLLDPPRLEHQRPLEGLRARQPHEDGPGRERLHGRQRPAEAAQHHRVASATAGTSPPTPSTPSTPRRRSTSAGPSTRSRTSASTPTWSWARRATRTSGRAAGGSRTPRAGRSSTRPTSSWRARRATSSGSRTTGTSSPRATASTRGSTST